MFLMHPVAFVLNYWFAQISIKKPEYVIVSCNSKVVNVPDEPHNL